MTLPSTDFMDDAACTGVPTDLFFPERVNGWDPSAKRQTRIALTYCAACPVQRACLEYGLDEPYGIFGGATPEERQVLRLRRLHRAS